VAETTKRVDVLSTGFRTKFGQFSRDFDHFIEIRQLTQAPLHVRVRTGLLSPELRSVACFRFGQLSESLYRRKKLLGLAPYVIAKLWHRHQVAINHVHLSSSARIGPGLSIMHGYSVLVGGSAVIGANCVLHHNVTIGEGVAGNSHAVPSLGSDVWVGPGVTIAGDVSIGDNVTISAGTVLTRSVPSDALVAGNPGRIVQLNYNLADRG
jgi:serine O-acetyltransferase